MASLARAELAAVLGACGYLTCRGMANAASCLMAENAWHDEGDLMSLECVSGDYFGRHCRTGDVLLAASRGAFSTGTRLLTQSPWTHSGVAYVAGSLGEKKRKRKIYEFGAHNPSEGVYNVCPDENFSYFRREPVPRMIGNGIGLYSLDVFAMNYKGLYWYPLPEEDVSESQRAAVQRSIENWLPLRNTPGSPEFAGPTEVLRSLLLPAAMVGTSFSTKIWCSTAVSMVLGSAGILRLTKDVSSYMPRDLADPLSWLPTCPHMGRAPKYVLGPETDVLNF